MTSKKNTPCSYGVFCGPLIITDSKCKLSSYALTIIPLQLELLINFMSLVTAFVKVLGFAGWNFSNEKCWLKNTAGKTVKPEQYKL